MVAAALFLLALGLAVRAWHAGRRADPARVPLLLVRFAIAGALAAILLPTAARVPPHLTTPFIVAAGLAAIAAFDALVSLALWGPFRRRAIAARAPFALTALLILLFHGPWRVAAAFAAIALISYRWRAALGTGALFRTFLGADLLLVLLLLPLPGRGANLYTGPLEPWVTFTGFTVGLVRVYTLIGAFKAFMAFARDPSLGIRTVTRRLALSHVLVIAVPLAITLTLWVATTYFGVNAERALAGRRLLEAQGEQLGASLRSAVEAGDGGAAARRLAVERGRRWPGVRLWLDRGRGLERALGDSIEGEARLAAWVAGLDSVPAHGVVGLRGRRWLGAAARGRGDPAAAVMLFPVRGVLDSTLAPVLQARYTMREGSITRSGGAAISEDTLSALMRDIDDIRSGRTGPRAGRRRMSSAGARPGGLVLDVGSERDTLRTSEAITSSGIASVTGPEFFRGHWRRSDFMLIGRADLRSTLVGLFANVRENPLQAVPIAMLGLIALVLLPVAVMDFAMVGGMGRSIAQAVAAVRDGAAALGRGELGYRIEIRGHDDLWETARQFNRMADGLERARAREEERVRLEGELELARRIQQRLLPGRPPAVPGLEIAGRSEPAREVGGDYYDHFDLGGGRVLLVIADVSGKGVPAALLMSGFRASLMSQDAGTLGPDRMAERVNEFLHRSVETGRFVTAFLGFLEASGGRLVYANAGHNPPALLRADGRVEWLSAGGLVLGIIPDSRFESGEATLGPGDLLALYTDGVTEAADGAGELWGEERLVATLRRLRERPCAEVAEVLAREVRTYEGTGGPSDDVTVLLARRT